VGVECSEPAVDTDTRRDSCSVSLTLFGNGATVFPYTGSYCQSVDCCAVEGATTVFHSCRCGEFCNDCEDERFRTNTRGLNSAVSAAEPGNASALSACGSGGAVSRGIRAPPLVTISTGDCVGICCGCCSLGGGVSSYRSLIEELLLLSDRLLFLTGDTSDPLRRASSGVGEAQRTRALLSAVAAGEPGIASALSNS